MSDRLARIRRYFMLPTMEKAKKELEIASQLNPGP